MTVKELYDEYIAAKKHEVRATSLQKTIGILERDVLPHLKYYKLDKLTTKVLQGWKNIIAEKSTKCTTKNNALRELRALLNYAVRLEYIEKNPVKNLGNFRDPNFEAASEKLHYYTADQFKAFIKQAESDCKSLTDSRFQTQPCFPAVQRRYKYSRNCAAAGTHRHIHDCECQKSL